MAYQRILITGGSGRLGRALLAAAAVQEMTLEAPSRAEMDLLDADRVAHVIERENPPVVIHAAAYVDAAKAEVDRDQCFDVNVRGTANLVRACRHRKIIYISTDYVFDGKQGNYWEGDRPNPVNWYGQTKLMGEYLMRPTDLILRAPFRDDPPWRYPRAFVDQWTSCDFASIRAPQILEAVRLNLTGILHIGGPRRSVYELAKEASPEVGRMWRSDLGGLRLPEDTSLDSTKWNSIRAALLPSSRPAATSISA